MTSAAARRLMARLDEFAASLADRARAQDGGLAAP